MTKDSATASPASLWNSCRLIYTLCAFTAAMNLMFVKFNISFALAYMVKQNDTSNSTNHSQETLFDWDQETQGHIMSSFFYGYLTSLLIGGWLSQKFYGKACFVVGNGGAAILNFIVPAAAYGGLWYLYTVRFLQGIFSGIMLPAIQLIFASWTHPDERTKLVSFSFGGYTVGIVLVNPISGLFCNSSKEHGWSYIFYFTGTLMLTCVIIYYFVVFDSVDKHPRISAEEKEYILSGITSNVEKKSIPYKSIFTSVPVYVYFITHCFQVFGYASITLTLPFFFKGTLEMGVIENGFVAAVPSIFAGITRFTLGQLFHPVHKRTKLSLTKFRKINHIIGTVVPGTIFLTITFIPAYYKIAIIILLSLVDSFSDFGYCASYAPSLIDTSSNFTGFLSGIATAIANLPFIAVSEIFGHLQKEGSKVYGEWKILWYVCSATYFTGGIVYVLFGTSEKQHWG